MRLAVLLFFLFLPLSCRQSDYHRDYLEIKIHPARKEPRHSFHPPSNPLAAPADLSGGNKINLKWTVPEGWSEKPGSGIRSATLLVREGAVTAECTIIQLPDSGGGLAGNVKRWMKQLNYIIPSEASLHAFLSGQKHFKTAGGFDGTMVDMTSLLSGDLTSQESVIAAVIPMKGQTVFLTMFGRKKLLQKNLPNFLSLGRSLQLAD